MKNRPGAHTGSLQFFAPSASVQNSKVEPDLRDKSLSIDDLVTDIEKQCENIAPALCLATDSDVQITESGVAPDEDTKTPEVDT